MNKFGLSALLLACVAFILLPGVSQAQVDDKTEVLKKLEVLYEEILQDSTIDSETREYIGIMKEDISKALDGEELSSEDLDVATQIVEAMLTIGKYGNETTQKLQEVHELQGVLKAQVEDKSEVLEELVVQLEGILEDSTIDSETREYIEIMKEDVSKALDNGGKLSSDYIDVLKQIVEGMLRIGGYGDETTQKLKEVQELLDQLE